MNESLSTTTNLSEISNDFEKVMKNYMLTCLGERNKLLEKHKLPKQIKKK